MAKTNKTTLKAIPPIADDNDEQQKALDDFLKAPERERKARAASPAKAKTETKNSATTKSKQQPLPWEEPGVSERVTKAFNLRFKEPDFLKLKFVFEQSRKKSIHSFCLEVVRSEVERRLKELI